MYFTTIQGTNFSQNALNVAQSTIYAAAFETKEHFVNISRFPRKHIMKRNITSLSKFPVKFRMNYDFGPSPMALP